MPCISPDYRECGKCDAVRLRGRRWAAGSWKALWKGGPGSQDGSHPRMSRGLLARALRCDCVGCPRAVAAWQYKDITLHAGIRLQISDPPFRFGIMFEFKRRNPRVQADGDPGRPPRHFQDGIAALRYACRLLECPLHEEAFLPAVVLDPREVFGREPAARRQRDGAQVFFLCVASHDGGFIVAATAAGPLGPRLEPGQLVSWKAVRHVPEVANAVRDPRFGWAGVIVGTLKLEHRDGCWVSDEIFRPAPVSATR